MKFEDFLNWKIADANFNISEGLRCNDSSGMKDTLKEWYNTFNDYLECLHYTEVVNDYEYNEWKNILLENYKYLYDKIKEWERDEESRTKIQIEIGKKALEFSSFNKNNIH